MTTPVYDRFKDHRASAIYDRFAETYDSAYASPLHQAEDLFVNDRLRQTIKPGYRVIDLGCGTGLFLDLHWKDPGNYVGVDISEKMLEVARRKHPSHHKADCFILADMTATGLFRRFEHAVCLYGGVSYNASLDLLDEIDRLLEPKGRFFLMFLGEGALVRPSEILTLSQDLWAPSSHEALRSVFSGVFENVSVVPLSGTVAAAFSTEAADLLDDPVQACLTLLEVESNAMLAPDGRPDDAYWQIVTGRKRG